MWMQADKVVAQSWRALDKKKVIFIPGFINRIVCTFFSGLFRYIASKRPVRPLSQNP
jgi:short-subunit dehydrogenase